MTLAESLDRLQRCLLNRDGTNPFAIFKTDRGNVERAFLDSLDRLTRTEATPTPSLASNDGPTSRELRDRISQSLAQLRALVGAAPTPILAIAGLLNSGKTSLVAGFLSSSGRARLLIGQSNVQGTHRFVIWLPDRWRHDAELWQSVLAQLESVFEHRPEELSDDPTQAFRQYNAVDSQRSVEASLRIPLVASDPALDRFNLGLMDCPDIQTGLVAATDRSSSNPWQATDAVTKTADQRERILRQGLHLASAFIVVTSANSLQDEYVDRLLEAADHAMPELPRILAINRVPRRYDVKAMATEATVGYAQYRCWRVYMAYHFDGPQLRERIPNYEAEHVLEAEVRRHPGDAGSSESPNLVGNVLTEGRIADHTAACVARLEEVLPIFFRIDHPEAIQPPAKIPTSDFLVQLGSSLTPSRLSGDLIRATLSNLRDGCSAAVERFRRCLADESKKEARVRRLLAESCLSLSMAEAEVLAAGEPELRLQVSREIVGQVAESLERTAPWWARPGRRMMRWSEQLRQATAGVTQWVTLPNWVNDRMRSSADWVKSRWRSGEGGKVISAATFFDALSLHDRFGDLVQDEAADKSSLLPKLSATIHRFQDESRTRLDDQQLDAYTGEMWNRMTWKQRFWTGLAPAGMLFAPLLAVVMLPMDFGGSTVLVFASMKELLFAGAAGVGMAMLTSDQMPKIAEKEAAWQQVGDLFAIACDEFDIPRLRHDETMELNFGGTKKALPRSQLTEKISVASEKLGGIHPNFPDQLERAFADLEQSLPKES